MHSGSGAPSPLETVVGTPVVPRAVSATGPNCVLCTLQSVPGKLSLLKEKKKKQTLEIDQFGRVRKMYNYFNFLERASGMGRGIQK